ncbi:MAG: 23S rRNA (adenine(1618)-N(6))-methyltransferase RlmF [Thalassotalea sp.]
MSIKSSLHPKNRFNRKYDFKLLQQALPALKNHLIKTKLGEVSLEFANPLAVIALNKALLMTAYHLQYWQIPSQNLCPAVPGRLDYLHYLNDLLSPAKSLGSLSNINALDIGTGASCIYPLLGVKEFDWRFVGCDIDKKSLNNSQLIIDANDLSAQISLRWQADENSIFQSIIQADEYYTFTLCNPPFHRSAADANQGSERKWKNLAKANKGRSEQSKFEKNTAGQLEQDNNKTKPNKSSALNFGGQNAELWCAGGEVKFIRNMLKESRFYAKQVLWFTSLVSKKDNLSAIKLSAKKQQVTQFKVIKMAQGNKISRFVAWSFMTEPEQRLWCQQQLVTKR